MEKKIRVLVIDDSAFFRTMLSIDLKNDTEIEVVGTAVDSYDAWDKLVSLKPDVMTVDIEMPKMSGIEFLKRVLPQHKVAAIVVTSSPTNAFEAISAGAVDYIRKPMGGDAEQFAEELRKKVKAAALSKPDAVKRVTASVGTGVNSLPLVLDVMKNPNSIIALGASTGGTDSLQVVLEKLPANTPPILIVQHMPPVFTKMYAERLNKACKIEVKEAVDGDRLKPGLAIVAAGEYHMRLKKDLHGYYITSQKGDKVSGHCPSVDVMFTSVAETAGSNAIGAILTGMGADGAEGLLKMRNAGAYTIGQDKETCVVYGMPMVAFNNGAVVKQAPLQDIAGLIIAKLKQ